MLYQRRRSPTTRRHRGGAAARRGRGARRAHDVARVRIDELDPLVPARRHAQPVEPRAHARRFVGRFGGRGRVGHDADLHRQRRRRLDPHPVRRTPGCSASRSRFGRVGDSGRVRQRAHVGARPDVPLGARRGALRRRDRGSDRSSTRRRCRVRRARTRTASLSGDAVAAAARQARGVVVDARLRGVRPRGREARARSRARARRRRRASSSSTSTSRIPKPSRRVGHPLDRSTSSSHHGEAARGPLPTTSRRCRATASRRSTRLDVRRSCCTRCGGATSCSPRSRRCSTRSTSCSRRRPRRPRSRPRVRRRWRSRASASAGWARCRTPRRSTSRASPRSASPPGSTCRRPAGRPAGRRPPPRRGARARVRHGRGDQPPVAQVRPDGVRDNRYPAARDRRRIRDGADRVRRGRSRKTASEEVTEVAPGVLRMQLPIWMPGLGHVNMYGLVDDRGLAVVDPGLPGPQSWKALKARLKTAGYRVKDIHTVRRHALASRPLRRRGPHRARSGRQDRSRTTRSRRGR